MTRRVRSSVMSGVAELAMRRAEQRFIEWNLSIPIRIDIIFAMLNVSVEVADLPQACPEVTAVDSDGLTVVALRRDDPLARQRFSAAHALGHLDLHRGRFVCVPGAKDKHARLRETEANAFAAALLMPQSHFQHRLRQVLAVSGMTPPMDLRTLADIEAEARLLNSVGFQFGVSREAVFYRLADLGLLSGAITLDELDEAIAARRIDSAATGNVGTRSHRSSGNIRLLHFPPSLQEEEPVSRPEKTPEEMIAAMSEDRICHNCGTTPRLENARFCRMCGQRLDNFCTNCNEALAADDEYCEVCGSPSSFLKLKNEAAAGVEDPYGDAPAEDSVPF